MFLSSICAIRLFQFCPPIHLFPVRADSVSFFLQNVDVSNPHRCAISTWISNQATSCFKLLYLVVFKLIDFGISGKEGEYLAAKRDDLWPEAPEKIVMYFEVSTGYALPDRFES